MTNQSAITRACTRDGSARIIVADTTAIVQRAHEIHETSKTVTAALGRALTAASLMGSLLKNRGDTVTLQFKGDGPAGRLLCIADDIGNVKGYVECPEVELPPNAKGKLDVGGAVGRHGTLTVIRDLGFGDPYVGVSDLVSGEIAEDITSYFALSEQTPTVCALGVCCNTDISCRAAGGFLLQLLPGADEAVIPVLETNIAALPPVSSMIADGVTREEIIARVLAGIPYDLFDEMETDYVCGCSRDSYARALISLGEKELLDMIAEDKPVETRCRYCRACHTFSVQELRQMVEAIRFKRAQVEAENAGESTSPENTER